MGITILILIVIAVFGIAATVAVVVVAVIVIFYGTILSSVLSAIRSAWRRGRMNRKILTNLGAVTYPESASSFARSLLDLAPPNVVQEAEHLLVHEMETRDGKPLRPNDPLSKLRDIDPPDGTW